MAHRLPRNLTNLKVHQSRVHCHKCFVSNMMLFNLRYGCFIARSMCFAYTVYPKKYAHGFCFAVLCCGYTLTDFPISIRLTSLALWQSNDCPIASKATLMNMDKYFMWIHYERLHNHNKAKHYKTVCIFLGICCILPRNAKTFACETNASYNIEMFYHGRPMKSLSRTSQSASFVPLVFSPKSFRALDAQFIYIKSNAAMLCAYYVYLATCFCSEKTGIPWK